MRKSVAQLRADMERLRSEMASPAFAEAWRQHRRTGEYPAHAETAEKIRDLRAGLLAMLAADAFSLEDIELQAGFILTADDWSRAGLDPDTVPATYPWEA